MDKVTESPVARTNAPVFWLILQQRESSLLKSDLEVESYGNAIGFLHKINRFQFA